MYTQNNEFILNAVIECIKFHIGNVLLESIHLTYVTVSAKTVPIGTTIEMHVMA